MTLALANVALALFAVAPHDLGGVRLRTPAGPLRDAWLAALREQLPADMPWRRLPLHASDEALDGGLDLAATLSAGRPVAERGLLAAARGGVVLAATAERLSAGRSARLCAALDDSAGQMALIALDEGIDDDEAPPASLLERLALQVQTPTLPIVCDARAIAAARASWHAVALDEASIEVIVATADMLGIVSSRAPWQAMCAARIAAAMQDRQAVIAQDLALAAQLVLAPRARRLPPDPQAPPPDSTTDARAAAEPQADQDDGVAHDKPLDDRVLEAVRAAIPPGLLASLAAGQVRSLRHGDHGRAGALAASRQRGRPIGSIRGEPRGGARLALIDTLRAAAPWQVLRRRAGNASTCVQVRRDDLRIQRRVQRRATTTIFAIDASGSQALHRLAEAKGAVELLLADCYARRDRVAVIGFRGQGAQLLLAPTRSLVRARRQLAGLPGGGGTPLAAGIDAATALVGAVRRSGATPLVVLLTDGRANIARDGTPGRARATADALSAARAFRAGAAAALLIDTSTQPSPAAAALAQTMCARCIVLPHAAADALSAAVRIERGSHGPRHV